MQYRSMHPIAVDQFHCIACLFIGGPERFIVSLIHTSSSEVAADRDQEKGREGV